MSGADDIDISPSLPSGALTSTTAVEGVLENPALEPSAAIRGDAAIAEALATGQIDSVAARELLLAEVVAEQLPQSASPESIQRLGAELRELLADDPTIERLLGRV